MRAIFTLVATLAIAHLLALAGFGGWLVATDRLNADRLEEIRELIETPADAEEEQTDEPESSSDASIEQASAPALSVEEQLAMRLDEEAIAAQIRGLAARQVRDLRQALQRDTRKLAEERAAFEAEKRAFEDYIQTLRRTDGSEQFQKAVALIERMDPGDVAQMMRAIIEGGAVRALPDDGLVERTGQPREQGLGRVVAYLNAMQERKRATVMGEFAAQDPALAAELLERLRMRGQRAGASEDDPR